MIQKSLQILIACSLLTLAAIVGYALLRFRGPEDSLREANQKLATGEYGKAIQLLDLIEHSPSIKSSMPLKEQLWRLRYAAHSRLDNPKGALLDVRSLLGNGFADDIELRLDEIRLLARAGDGEGARARAKELLEQHPDHPRGLELAGEACQTAYQPLMRALHQAIENELGKHRRDEARDLLLSYLFRPAGDPAIERAGNKLAELFAGDPRLIAAWPVIWRDAQQVRERVQEGLGYFQRSLDLGDEPVAAFRAVATALEQSGRIDDLLFTCEIQRRMFDHAYVGHSGTVSAFARLQANLPEDTMACSERWLPTDAIGAMAEAGRLDASSEQLLQARALAAWRLRDLDAIRDVGKLVTAVRQEGLTAIDGLHLWLACQRMLTGTQDPEQIESSLRQIVGRALRQPPRLRRPDLAAEFAPLWIEYLIADNAGEGAILAAIDGWRAGRPDELTPLFERARYLVTLGRTAAALAALDDAKAIDPEHPELFPLRLEIARQHYADSEQDGPGLLAQCLRNRKNLPDPTDPIGFVLCAEAALDTDTNHSWIAVACARRAIGEYPQQNIPRQLELRALLRQQQLDDARRAAALTLEAIRPDADTLALVIEAYRQSGTSIREVVRQALPTVARAPQLQIELLRIALADAPRTAHWFVDPSMTAETAEFGSRLLAIRAATAAGELARARDLLRELSPPTDATLDGDWLQAFADWLLAQAKQTDDEALLPMLRQLWPRPAPGAAWASLITAARALHEQHPHTARLILQTALPQAQPAERTGSDFVLAGELALAAGDPIRAQSDWVAALGFPDGQPIAERLARLLLLQDEERRARRVYKLVQKPTDPALALLMGADALAPAILGANLQARPADLLVHALMMTLGQPALLDWSRPEEEELLRERLELLTALFDPALATLAVPRAEAMLRADDKVRTHRFLLARAMADAGRPAAAAQQHAMLFRSGYRSPVLWREVSYAGQDPGYRCDPELATVLMMATTGGQIGSSKLALAYGSRLIVQGFYDKNLPDLARQTQLGQWLATPRLLPSTSEDLERIASGHAPVAACTIFDEILQAPHPIDRTEVLRHYYDAARALLARRPAAAQTLLPQIQRHLATDGALGLIVHFVIEHQLKIPGSRPVELLQQNLEMIATGRDDPDQLERTMSQLLEVGNPQATMRTVDELLDRYPTTIELWAWHARLRARYDGDASALDDLRTVLTHASAPHAELSFLALAAAERRLQPDDFERLAALPQELLDSPRGHYVQALVALRRGQIAESLPHFELAEPQHDGRHLYGHALARLEGTAEDDTQKASELLEQLIRDYPRSSLARHAGSFVAQLSPRAASADDNDENR